LPTGEFHFGFKSASIDKYRLTIVTGNIRHFAGIPGLKVENWLAP
jgi:predicted nucleic acid-binding protein